MIPQAGQLNTPCRLEIMEQGEQALGGERPREWVDRGLIWIRLRAPRADEIQEHDRTDAQVQWQAETWWHPLLDRQPTARLRAGNRLFEIKGVVDTHGDRKGHVLTLEERI